MRVLTDEAQRFFSDQLSQYLHYWESERDITSAHEYLNYVGKLSDFDDSMDIRIHLDKVQFKLKNFYQIASLLDQDVMYLSLNPGMQSHLSQSTFDNRGEYGRLGSADGDLKKIAWTITSHFDTYLTKTPGAELIIRSLQQSLDQLPSDVKYDDYVDVNSPDELRSSFFGDVYHSRVFKFPSPKKSDLNRKDLRFGRETFAEEIEMVNPSLLVCGCRSAWLSVYRHLVNTPEVDIIPHRESNVTDNYRNNDVNSATAGVFEVPEYDLWVITVFHESRLPFIEKERLEENLRYVNERLA